MQFWGRKANWFDKSDIKIFANFTRNLKVDLQWIYFCCISIGNAVFHAVSY